MKKKLILAAFALLLLTGCAENPDSDIIVHKDMEKLIDEAQQNDESKAEVADFQQYDHYTADLENEGLHVTVHADADVDIPQAEKLSVFRVKQHDFTQEDVDRVRAVLLGDTPLYDGTLMNEATKADLEPEIAAARAGLEAETAKSPQDESEKHNREVRIQEYQHRLDELQKHYEAAPIERSLVLSDGILQNAAEKFANGDNPAYWEWQNELGCKETLEERNADDTAVLYVQNNENYSNKICFRTSPIGAESTDGVMVLTESLDAVKKNGIADPFLDHRRDLQGVKVEPMPDDSCELTREQAEEKAQEFLKEIGQEDFACFEGGRYAEYVTRDDLDEHYYRTCWILRYCREIDGVLLEQSSGVKFAETGSGEDYRKHLWPEEMIELHINDSGIVWLDWNAPLEITETVVDHAALQPFETVRATFERMMPMTGANNDPEHYGSEITIDRVTLSYSRISEKDSFDTGLVVPVWGFIGTRKDVLLGEGYGQNPRYYTQMAINAIDGSVIDATLGY